VSINPHKPARPEDPHRPAPKIADFQLFFSGAGLFSPNPAGRGGLRVIQKNFPKYPTRPAQSNKKKKKKTLILQPPPPHLTLFSFLFFFLSSLLSLASLPLVCAAAQPPPIQVCFSLSLFLDLSHEWEPKRSLLSLS
jgi:hypothetical protein